MVNADTTTISTASQAIKDQINADFGIESPSLFMMEVGGFLIEGLVMGVNQGLPIFNLSMAQMQAVVTTFSQNANVQLTSIGGAIDSIGIRMLGASGAFAAGGQRVVSSSKQIRLEIDRITSAIRNLTIAIDDIPAFPGSNAGGGGSPPQGRAFGGDVRRGQVYEFNEPGLPFEVAQFGNRNFMLPNQNGRIISPLNSTPPPRAPLRGGSGGSGGSTTISYGDINIAIPETVREVTPEAVKDGLRRWHEDNPPQRERRNFT